MPDRRALLERQARLRWLEFAAWMGFGICDECGDAAYLARQSRGRKRLCLDCWDQGFR